MYLSLFLYFLWVHPHYKKRLMIFPSPAGMSLTKLSLAVNNYIIPGNNYINPGHVDLVSDGDGFFTVQWRFILDKITSSLLYSPAYFQCWWQFLPSLLRAVVQFSKIYWAICSDSPKVELRFCPWLLLFKYCPLHRWVWPELLSVPIVCISGDFREGRHLRSASGQRISVSSHVCKMT